MSKAANLCVSAAALLAGVVGVAGAPVHAGEPFLLAGAAAVDVTPAGPNPAWRGWVDPVTGLWGEEYVDVDGSRHWDPGEPFVDDAENTLLDPVSSAGRYDGPYIAGYGTNRLATGVHDPQWARALALELVGAGTLVFVTIDNVGYFFERIEALRQEAFQRFGVEKIVFSSTHNHEAVDTVGLWGLEYGDDGKTPRYMRFLHDRILDAVGDAVAALEPASLRAGQVDAARELLDRGRPPGVVDPAVTTLQAVRADGSAIGTLTIWGVHTESLGSQNRLLTSDYPHYLRSRVEAEAGGVALFAEGAIGAVGPGTVRGADGAVLNGFDRARVLGETVADLALASLEGAPTFVPDGLHYRTTPLLFDASNTFLLALNQAGVFDRQTYVCHLGPCVGAADRGTWLRSEVGTLTFGDFQLATVPGELFPELAVGGSFPVGDDGCPGPAHPDVAYREPVLKPLMTGRINGILGVTSDLLGYIVPLNDYEAPDFTQLATAQDVEGVDRCGRGHYHETVSADRELAPAVTEALRDLLAT